MTRGPFASAILIFLSAHPTIVHSDPPTKARAVSVVDGAKTISGSLVHADKCGGFRSVDGRLSDWEVPNGTLWDRRDGQDRLTFPDGSVAESGKEYQFLAREIEKKSECHPTTVVLYRVLDGKKHAPPSASPPVVVIDPNAWTPEMLSHYPVLSAIGHRVLVLGIYADGNVQQLKRAADKLSAEGWQASLTTPPSRPTGLSISSKDKKFEDVQGLMTRLGAGEFGPVRVRPLNQDIPLDAGTK